MKPESTVTGGHLAGHIAQTARLAVPVMLSRAGLVLMLTVDTAIVGHLDAAGMPSSAKPRTPWRSAATRPSSTTA